MVGQLKIIIAFGLSIILVDLEKESEAMQNISEALII